MGENTSVKPCDEPCPKCGSMDVSRRWFCVGAVTGLCSGQPPLESSRDGFAYRANREHVAHNCRVCQYRWAGDVLGKVGE